MFIRSLSANDQRFRTVEFHDGLNLLVADRTDMSEQGDSRNGTGKSSLVRILRYLLGGNLPDEFKTEVLDEHLFRARFGLPNTNERSREDSVVVERTVKPRTQVEVSGWSALDDETIHVDEWRALVAEHLFRLDTSLAAPSPGQLWGQIVRTHFGDPVKSYPTDPDWVTGTKIGYFLGLAPENLNKSGDVERLKKQRLAIRKAVSEGALGAVTLDEAELRSQLVVARRRRDATEENLRAFRVDEQYGQHQREADALTHKIRSLNDEALALEGRHSDLLLAIEAEGLSAGPAVDGRLASAYSEIGLAFSEIVVRRYEEVERFHASVVKNRRLFLADELALIERRLAAIGDERSATDAERSRVMQLLGESVAMATFVDAQASLAETQSHVAELERHLEIASRINEIDNVIALARAESVSAVRNEVEERSAALEWPIALFNELGKEIYVDREASLRVSATSNGLLKVQPHVPGDASEGIRGVETFLLDIVCLVSALRNDRAPRILVHDSHLFDSVDHRQVASCLNIGARLAEEYDFQYIVTMNSDFLSSVISQSDGAFDSETYELSVRLEDEPETGKLFGFNFE